jgi:23S rRNA (adenine2030-N6)-methyltransferase
MSTDYRKLISSVKEGLKRFSNGIYLIWLPDINRYEIKKTIRSIISISPKNHYYFHLQILKNRKDALGLKGSHVIIINPPFGLIEQVEVSVKFLKSFLKK